MAARRGRRRTGLGLAALALACTASALTVSQRGGGAPPIASPSPYVLWVENPIIPTTTPPLPEQCHGCACLIGHFDTFVANGAIVKGYTCRAAMAGAGLVPELRWSGMEGGPQDESSMTFAVTVSDLDAPNGEGSGGNAVRGLFWAANIPGDWRELSSERLASDKAGVTIGRGAGSRDVGMVPICPAQGKHRVRVTIWAVRSALLGLSSDTPYSEVVSELESSELARATAYAEIAALTA